MWFEDAPLGEKVTLGSYTFTTDNIIAFAKKYDPQPFHLDAEAAAHSPYGGLIASGWHTSVVWMKLMIAHRNARVAAGEELTQVNYVSPGVRDIRWLKPVRPGMTLTYTNENCAKRDWPSLPAFGLLEGNNEARTEDGTLVYTFVNRVLIARKPTK
ncbi:MAG TPA: MaoC/PaaZ C-terminal domain-containing protein [Micropepsaceae bacterium]|nr:MaoC/PaaZ C-terminal domain-containing protein [Micropepsaceae bacterium]